MSSQQFTIFERKINEKIEFLINEKIESLQKSLERCHCRSTGHTITESVLDLSFAGSCDDKKERNPGKY